jgi:hypothetical protein
MGGGEDQGGGVIDRGVKAVHPLFVESAAYIITTS